MNVLADVPVVDILQLSPQLRTERTQRAGLSVTDRLLGVTSSGNNCCHTRLVYDPAKGKLCRRNTCRGQGRDLSSRPQSHIIRDTREGLTHIEHFAMEVVVAVIARDRTLSSRCICLKAFHLPGERVR